MNRRTLGVVIGLAAVVAAVLYLGKGRTSHSVADGSAAANAGGASESARVAAERPHSIIRGAVTDAKGPVVGASVCAATHADVQACAATDANGRYEIRSLAADTYRVTASAAQHRPATYGVGTPTGSWIALGNGAQRDNVDLVLRAGVLLSGTVQDINGGPIAGAKVRVRTEGGFETLGETRYFWSPPALSAKDGAFALWVAPGSASVTAVADGYGESSVDAEAPTSVVLLLTPEGSVTGTVVDASDHPVGNAVIVARSLHMVAETTADEEGAFTIGHLTAERFTITAHTANAYASAEVAIALGQQATLKLHLLPAARISGVVMLGAKPCPEPRVDIRDPRTEIERSMIDDGHDGAVHIDGVLAGEYVLHPQCLGGYEQLFPLQRLVVTGAEQSDLIWAVVPGAVIRGRVTNETGAPVADVTVEAKGGWSEDARTSDDGTYAITGLRAGNYTVTATAVDGGHAEAPLTLAEGEQKQVDLKVEASARIAGTLVDATGRPVSGLEIRADPKDKERAEGTSLSAPEVTSTGTFDIAVKPGAYHVYAAVDWTHPIAPGADVSVAAGQRVSVQIKVPAQDGVIKGKVVDAYGAAVTDAVVTASVPSMFDGGFTLGWNEHPVLTSADGSFTITALGPGSYTVKASRPGAPVAEQKDVQPGATVALTIAMPTSIVGNAAYPDGKHPREFVVNIRSDGNAFYREETFVGTNGVFLVEDVAPGPLQLTVTDPAHGFVATKLTLAPGEAKKDLALVLTPMVEIHGRLVDSKTKQPLAKQIVLAESADSVQHPSSFWDDFAHLTAADGTFKFMAPSGGVTVSSQSFDMETRTRCEGKTEETIDGPTDVGDVELVCKRLGAR